MKEEIYIGEETSVDLVQLERGQRGGPRLGNGSIQEIVQRGHTEPFELPKPPESFHRETFRIIAAPSLNLGQLNPNDLRQGLESGGDSMICGKVVRASGDPYVK